MAGSGSPARSSTLQRRSTSSSAHWRNVGPRPVAHEPRAPRSRGALDVVTKHPWGREKSTPLGKLLISPPRTPRLASLVKSGTYRFRALWSDRCDVPLAGLTPTKAPRVVGSPTEA